MPSILSLPAEILHDISCHITNINDALHLARASQYLHRFYRAVVVHWIGVEAGWLARITVYGSVAGAEEGFAVVTMKTWTD
ncbi:hypothetical protein BO70DRAFT_359488 [Aspergillus heteromorphus CBS 117.55]|uniref:F-box domain-containing protein n=1 Tax=Aspergillus heteromorphus CBS 117.55 TaxID=1448321 RepID=A0A317WV57_9EURO|nr:uncharacterized protein BO70DRAFT_359488 [Aspergillus heteromorphus CBS 117.55]PWY89192.1 hypothetical protein BO70DRAFT_359488 [Aspergillus heteromorphus CBS 117.55]